MVTLIRFRTPRRVLSIVATAALVAGWLTPAPAAEKLEQLDTSLRLVPADAAFYSSMLRNREQVEAFLASKAWKRIQGMPAVQMGLGMLEMEAEDPDSPVAQVMQVLEDPNQRQSLHLAADLLSHEVFLYGDADFVGTIDLFQQLNGAMRFGPAMMEVTGESAGMESESVQAAVLFGVLADNLDKIKVPGMVIGMKTTKEEQVRAHVEMLEGILRLLLAENDQLKDCLKRTRIDGREYLAFTLDGAMIPWDEVPLDEVREVELEEGQVDKVMARVKKLKVSVFLGLRDDYLLLAVGSTDDCIKRLGEGPSLATRKELGPLEKYADRRLASIDYYSAEIARQLVVNDRDIDEMLQMGREMLPLAGLEADMERKVLKDARALAEDLKAAIPEPGPRMAFAFLTDRGMEGYAYDWTAHPELDASKPLDMLRHVGGRPILAVVSRSRLDVAQYDAMVKWAGAAYGYFEEFALPEMDEVDREQFEEFKEKALPLVERFDKATRNSFIPALADGQAGLVLDARFTTRRLHAEMPEMDKPMPLVEPAVLVGVSDAKALVQAMSEYREVFNGFAALLHEIEPGDFPEFAIPELQSEKIQGGRMYYYPLPKEWGLDDNILPNAAVSKSLAAITGWKGHSRRLLAETPLEAGGVLGGAEERPLAQVVIFDFAALVDAAAPWVEFAAEKVIEEEIDGDEAQAKMILQQVRTGLELLKCLRCYTSEYYFEDGALVTHSLTEIRDVE